jgi:hypothetical protein
LKTPARILLIALGYIVAFAVAAGLTWLYIVLTDSPEKQASSGMAAFGEAMLFLLLFVAGAAAVTAAGLYALRPKPMIWRVGVIGAVTMALGGLATMIVIGWIGLANGR